MTELLTNGHLIAQVAFPKVKYVHGGSVLKYVQSDENRFLDRILDKQKQLTVQAHAQASVRKAKCVTIKDFKVTQGCVWPFLSQIHGGDFLKTSMMIMTDANRHMLVPDAIFRYR